MLALDFFLLQLSRPVVISRVVVFWKKKASRKLNYNEDLIIPTSWFLLRGLEANTTYEIQVQVTSDIDSIPISDPVFATTHAKREQRIEFNLRLL